MARTPVARGAAVLLASASVAAIPAAARCGTSSFHRGRTPPGKIVYVPARRGGTDVRVRQLNSATLDWKRVRLLLRAPGAISAATWAPGGRRIAVSYARGEREDGALIVDVRSNVLARLSGRIFANSWSRDGKRLATDGSAPLDCQGHAVKRQLRLRVFSATGRLVRVLPLLQPAEVAAQTQANVPEISSIAWAPGARRIAYVVSNEGCESRAGLGPSNVRVVDVASGEVTMLYRPSTNEGQYIGTPAWSHDGSSVAFAAGCDGVSGEGCSGGLVVLGGDRRDRSVLRPQDTLVDTVAWTRGDTVVFGTPFSARVSPAGLAAIDVKTKRWRWIVRAPTHLGSLVDAAFPIFRLSGDGLRIATVESYSSGIAVSALDGSRSWRTHHAWTDDRVIEDVYVP